MIWQVVGVCLLCAVASLVLRQYQKSDMALLLCIACSCYVFALCVSQASEIISSVASLADKSGLDNDIFLTVIRITGIAYITQTGAELCRDAGESALAGKIEIGGKLVICAAAVPAVSALFDVISDML